MIVNTSSPAGLQRYGGLAAYMSSKRGPRGLDRAAALDLAPGNIRVLSLHPGPISTPMTEDMPDEVARMVRFMLCAAGYSTGSEFIVDGGAVTGQVLVLEQPAHRVHSSCHKYAGG